MSAPRPMKGWNKPFDPKAIRYPVWGSLKLDGIRGWWVHKEFLSSSMTTLPNRNVQRIFAALGIPATWDGELGAGEMKGEGVYYRTESIIMSRDKPADDVKFYVFDNVDARGTFEQRHKSLFDISDRVVVLPQKELRNADEVQEFYEAAVLDEYEGIVLRSLSGLYKFGRSTFREQYMLKMKPCEDAEGKIIGFEELEVNLNEAELNNFGLTKRSSRQDGKIPGNTLGAVLLDWNGITVRVGCFKGISKAELQAIWNTRDQHMGRLVKFKYFPYGVKKLPRQARAYKFVGFRHLSTL